MQFIKQSDDYTCRLITLLNAHIHRYGHCPIDYGTKEYFKFFKEHDKGKHNGGIESAYEYLGAKRVPFSGSGAQFKKWFYDTIIKGGYIDFSGYCRNLHSFLVAEYCKEKDSFMAVNSGIYSKETVEWLPLPILMKMHTGDNSTIAKYKEIKFNNIIADTAAIIFDENRKP